MDNVKYIRLIIDFVNSRYDDLYMGKYKFLHIYKYCLDMSYNDNVDKNRIKLIIRIVLKYLLDNGYLIKFKDCYMTKEKIDYNNVDYKVLMFNRFF